MLKGSRDKLTVLACVVCTAAILGVLLAFPIWAPAWMSDFGANRGSVMMVYSATGIFMTLSFPVVGRLLVRTPAWRLIVIGAIMIGGGIIAASMIKSYSGFAAVYALTVGPGVALAGVLPCQTLAARLFPSHVGVIGGLLSIGMAVSGVALPLLLTPLEAAIGWRAALAATGAGVLVLVPLLAILFMRKVAAGPDPHSAGVSGVAPSTGQILKSAGFWLILAGMVPLMAAPTAVQANLLPILADHGVGQREASLVLSALAVGTALGSGLFGWLVDRFDPRLVFLAAAALMAGALFALARGHGLPVAVAAAVALGVPGGGILPLTSVLVFRQFPSGYAPALGLLSLFTIPYTFAAPLIGWIRDQTGSYSLSLTAAAPLVILGAACIWWLKSAATKRVAPLVHAPAE